jgi:hypothetical protein
MGSTSISASDDDFACGIASENVYCWGDNMQSESTGNKNSKNQNVSVTKIPIS